MNHVVLMGRLTADPNVNTSNSGAAVAKYRLAVNRRKDKDGNQETDFINCVCFGKTADFAGKYLHKGVKIAVQGEIRTGSYTNKDGAKVYTTDVVVNSHEFCESKSNNGNSAYSAQPYNAPQNGYSAPAPDDYSDFDGEDVPF